MKRFIGFLLIVFVIAGMTVLANDVAVANQDFDEVVCSYGKILDLGDNYILVEAGNKTTIQFNYDENTYLIDSKTVSPLSLKGRTTDSVAVYHNMAMTKSLPAQAYAYSIVGNIENALDNPIYTVVEAVSKTENGISITTDGGSLIINIPATAKVSPYLTKNIVTLDNITVNSKVLLWYDAVTMSIPSYSSSERVVLLESGTDDLLMVNGISITLKDGEKPYVDNDVHMLPLRTVAEALGYKVTWSEADLSISVEKGDFSTVVYIDAVNDCTPASVLHTLPDKPHAVLNGDKTYIEEDFFAQL